MKIVNYLEFSVHILLYSFCNKIQLLYASFWVIPRRLNFVFRNAGTQSLDAGG